MHASAQESIDILLPYIEADEPTPPEAASEVVALQRSIIKDARGVGSAVTRVEDVTPWWAKLLTVIAVALLLAGVVFIGIRTGFFALIGGLVHLITPRLRRRKFETQAEGPG